MNDTAFLQTPLQTPFVGESLLHLNLAFKAGKV